MSKLSKTWWGEQFIAGLTQFLDEGRLKRGRSYRSDRRILSFAIKENLISATLRGNVNPYFGVYEEPKYKVKIEITRVAPRQWTKIISRISGNAAFVSQLLLNEMPAEIATAFSGVAVPLLPRRAADFKTNCSCPDYANPCKHIAGVYYRVAAMLDADPFLMFGLRGLSREKLQQELAKSPLGQALSAGLDEPPVCRPVARKSYYTPPGTISIPPDLSLKHFWSGPGGLRETAQSGGEGQGVSAILIKKQGDYPPFWKSDHSFITAMEEIYAQVKKKNSGSL